MQPHIEILNQLGGNRFLAMTGSKNLSYSEKENNYLQMRLARNKIGAQFLKIELTVMDTYKMIFTKAVGKKYEQTLVTLKVVENVYCDMLQSMFTEVTGLYTHL